MKQQRGISLIVVLIGLVIISFAAVALLRSTDTATLIAGNLGFKKAALASGDAGSEAAIAWLDLNASGNTLHEDQEDVGYYASSRDACDLTGSRTPGADDDVDWSAEDPKEDCNEIARELGTPAGAADGYLVSYVINRMCNGAGSPNNVLIEGTATAMTCASADSTGSGDDSTKVGPDYSGYGFSGSTEIYYRITTRITGPRNTVRYSQTWVVM